MHMAPVFQTACGLVAACQCVAFFSCTCIDARLNVHIPGLFFAFKAPWSFAISARRRSSAKGTGSQMGTGRSIPAPTCSIKGFAMVNRFGTGGSGGVCTAGGQNAAIAITGATQISPQARLVFRGKSARWPTHGLDAALRGARFTQACLTGCLESIRWNESVRVIVAAIFLPAGLS